MGVLTGIIRVIKAGIFSDLNNLSTYTILSDVYTDSYGLTEEEVEKSLKDYGIEAEISKVKDWYDGYKFGDSEVYNPWSILNFLQDKELRAYWVDTSGNDLINDVLKKMTKDTVKALERLFDGEGLRQNISGTSDLSKLLDENELWELLLFSGYLTIEEKIDQKNYILRLPNKEVKELFKDSFLEKYFGRGNKLSDLMEALTENRIEDYEESLQEILLTSVSYNDTKKGNEAFYHGLIMGMGLYLEGEYITKSNIESGLGRYDFLIEPKNKSKRAFIMEFKSTDSVEKLEEVSKEALKQIDGIGDIVASNIYNFFRKEKNRDIILKLKKHGIRMEVQEEKENLEDIEIVSDIFKDKIFVLTGNFSKPKKEIEKEIIANGGIVKSSITKDTNIVIYEKETSSKYKKAEKLGIERITEEEYNNMLK